MVDCRGLRRWDGILYKDLPVRWAAAWEYAPKSVFLPHSVSLFYRIEAPKAAAAAWKATAGIEEKAAWDQRQCGDLWSMIRTPLWPLLSDWKIQKFGCFHASSAPTDPWISDIMPPETCFINEVLIRILRPQISLKIRPQIPHSFLAPSAGESEEGEGELMSYFQT